MSEVNYNYSVFIGPLAFLYYRNWALRSKGLRTLLFSALILLSHYFYIKLTHSHR